MQESFFFLIVFLAFFFFFFFHFFSWELKKKAKNWAQHVGLYGKSESTYSCPWVRETNLFFFLGLNFLLLATKKSGGTITIIWLFLSWLKNIIQSHVSVNCYFINLMLHIICF